MNALVGNHPTPAASGLSWFAPIRNLLSSLAAASRAAERFERLSGLGDEQLARRGLRRAEIARHVARIYIDDISAGTSDRHR